MINSIIRFSVHHRGVVIFLTLLLAVLGWFSFVKLPIDAVPDITNTQVQVFTEVVGLAPEEVERTVTFPIENGLAGIPGVNQIRSLTRFGLSVIAVVFDDGADIYRARQLVSERLLGIADNLPTGASPKLGPISTGLGEIFFYAIEAETPAVVPDERAKQLMELRALQEWYVKPRLLNVPGVAEVNTIGGFEKQFHIRPDPRKLAQFGLSFEDIGRALEATNRNVGGGYVQQSSEQFLVQGAGLLSSPQEIEGIPIKLLETLKPIRVRDVATVALGTELRTGAAVVGSSEAVLGTVMMLMGENSREVSLRTGEKVAEIQKGLPTGIKLQTLYDRSDLVNKTLATIEHNLLVGASLVVIVLLLLLGSFRAAVITALVIPLSLLFTFIVMKRFGVSGNLLSLGALDFGIIVDGAVIVLDHCVRKVQEKAHELGRSLSSTERKSTVIDATIEIRTAAGFGQLIVVVVFLPVLGLSGIEGKMFQPMAASFAIAVLGALVLSFSTAPALASIFLRGSVKERDPMLMRLAEGIYTPILGLALRLRFLTVLLGIAALLIGIILFGRLGAEFLPQMDEASRTLQFVRPVNISLAQSLRLQELSQRVIEKFPEVQTVFSRIGTAEVATDPMGVNLADTFITFKDRSQWPNNESGTRTWGQVTQKIVDELERQVPGQRVLVSQPIQMRFNELLEGVRADVSVKVFGEEMEVLTELAESIAAVVRDIPGAADVEVELQGASPILKILPKRDLLSELGVGTTVVLDTVRQAMAGQEVGYIYDGVRRYPIVIRLDEELRQDLAAIRSIPIEIAERTTMPLSAVASIQFDETFGTINREQAKRRVAVMINLRGTDTETFVLAAKKAVSKKVTPPAGYYLEWGGNFKNLEEARRRLSLFVPIVLLLVLGMVFMAFGSIPQTILVFVGIPLALVGGVLGLRLNGLPFSISAGIGFIALAGVSVLNGVVLVNCMNDLRARGESGRELVMSAARLRIRPVLMTALVAIFGFIPMMLSTGVGAEVQRPLASVVIGGLFSSTLLTLIVLPSLYLIFESWMELPVDD